MTSPPSQLGEVLIRFTRATKTYEPDGTVALQDFDIEIRQGEILSLVGPSGCGKTTVIKLIAGFIDLTSGTMKVTKYPFESGVVFQAESVFPWMKVRQNIGYGLRFNGTNLSDRQAIIEKYVNLVGLSEFQESWPRDLSGGMRKRTELARTLAANPEVMLLDEPFASLDVLTKEQMQLLLLKIWEEERKTILLVTHDPEEAVFLGHRVAVMSERPGHIKCILEVPFQHPRQPSLKLESEFLNYRREVVLALSAR